MIYFTSEQVIRIHTSLIRRTNGMDGLKDPGLFDSALMNPLQVTFGQELYPTIIDKAAQLYYGMTKNHPFCDGNKRIGLHLALVLFKVNGVELKYTQEELIDLGWGVGDGRYDKDYIKDWFEKHKV